MTATQQERMMPAVAQEAWRDEDEALYARLLDESALERLFRSQTGADLAPPRRAAGLAAALRKTPGGAAALEAARAGDLAPLVLRVDHPAKLEGAPPELLHHLALYQAHVSDAKGGSDSALVRSITAWLALGKEGRYLRELAEAVTAGALAKPELENALAEAGLWPIDELGEQARKGARDLTPASSAALAALERVPEACTLAKAPDTLARAAMLRAASLSASAIEDALGPVLLALAELAAKPDPNVNEAAALLGRVAAVWVWSGKDESVEHVAVEQTSPLAWTHYRASRWKELGMLIEPVWPLVDSLATRIQGDPTKLAYAAGAAQMVVFRSDVTRGRAETLALLERALAVCPSHRNARLRIANELCEDALKLLPGARAPTRAGYDQAAKLIQRAETLYPAATGLAEAQKRLGEAKKLLGFTP